MRTRAWRTAILGVAVLFGAACGGGDSSDDDSKGAFIEKADALCKATVERLEQSGISLADPGEAVEQALPAAEALVADLKAIPPPHDSQTTAIMAEYDKTLGQFRDVVAARSRGDDVTEQRLLNQIQSESASFEKKLKDYGFKECGQD